MELDFSINMKEEPGKKWSWLLFLLFCAFNLTAQETFTFENGSFELLISANPKGFNNISKVPVNPNGVSLDFDGVEKPQLKFRIQNVKWDGIEGASLVVKSDWVSCSPGIKKYTARDINLKRSSRGKNILFEPKANGRQTVTIKYGILKSGEDNATLQPIAGNTIVQEIIVKGLKDDQKIEKVEPPKFKDDPKDNPGNGGNPIAEDPNKNGQGTTPPPIKDWSIGISGNTYSFKEGSVKVRLINGNEQFAISGPSTIDFSSSNESQMFLQLSDLKWKDPNDIGTLVIRPDWLYLGQNLSSTFNGVELRQGQSKSIPIKVKSNGDGFVRLQFGYRSKDGTFNGPIGPGIDKQVKITGFGASGTNNETASTDLTKVDPAIAVAEEKAWQLAKQENTFQSYLAYWNQYRNTGKYSKECAFLISKINIDYEVLEQKETDEGKQYTIRLNNIQRFTIDTIGNSTGLTTRIDEDNNIIAIITDGKKHTIKVDAQFRRTLEIELDPKTPPIKASFMEGEKGNINFEISGGKGSPYYLYIIDVKTNTKICDLGRADTKTNVLDKNYIYSNCPLKLDGDYKIEVKDVRKTERVVSETTFFLKSSDNKGILSYLWVLLLVLLIPIGIIIKKNL